MKLCFKILAIAIVAASTYPLVSCAGPAGFSYKNVSISIATACSDCPGGGNTYNPAQPNVLMMTLGGGQGGTEQFTATVTNAPPNVTWTIYPQPNLSSVDTPPTGTSTPVGESGSSVGSFVTSTGNALSQVGSASVYYNGPGSPPVYGGVALQQAQTIQWYSNGVLQTGIPQGDVLIVASVPIDPTNPSAVYSQGQLVQIFSNKNAQGPPSVYLTPQTGSTPPNQTQPAIYIARGATYQFYGGTVGAAPCLPAVGQTTCTTPVGAVPYTADNSSDWLVGPAPFSLTTAVVGGNSTLGTIDQNGKYTAPAVVPSPLPVVIVRSHFLPSVATYANVGIY
jgi:hypothetical protein